MNSKVLLFSTCKILSWISCASLRVISRPARKGCHPSVDCLPEFSNFHQQRSVKLAFIGRVVASFSSRRSCAHLILATKLFFLRISTTDWIYMGFISANNFVWRMILNAFFISVLLKIESP